MKRHIIAAMTLVAGISAGLVASNLTSDEATPAQRASTPTVKTLTAHALDWLPNGTLTDWVTYADHVAVVRFDSSRAIAPSQAERDAGEGFIPRATSFSVVDVIWTREGAPPPPKTLEFGIDGWSFEGDRKLPLKTEGQPAIDKLGTEYLMPISYIRKDGTALKDFWTYLSAGSILPVFDEVVANVDQSESGAPVSAATKAMAGHKLAEISSILEAQPADPFAAPFANDPPTTRFNKAYEAKQLDRSDK